MQIREFPARAFSGKRIRFINLLYWTWSMEVMVLSVIHRKYESIGLAQLRRGRIRRLWNFPGIWVAFALLLFPGTKMLPTVGSLRATATTKGL